MTVYVVTNPEHGWDCVCGVYSKEENIPEEYKTKEDIYVIHKKQLQ